MSGGMGKRLATLCRRDSQRQCIRHWQPCQEVGQHSAEGWRRATVQGPRTIQVTGRTNYKLYGVVIGKDMEDLKQQNWLLLREPHYAADSAGWFWKTHFLNGRADRDEHTNITKDYQRFDGYRAETVALPEAQR